MPQEKCYCGVDHCSCCGANLSEENPPYANPSLIDERWVCEKCARDLTESARW